MEKGYLIQNSILKYKKMKIGTYRNHSNTGKERTELNNSYIFQNITRIYYSKVHENKLRVYFVISITKRVAYIRSRNKYPIEKVKFNNSKIFVEHQTSQ